MKIFVGLIHSKSVAEACGFFEICIKIFYFNYKPVDFDKFYDKISSVDFEAGDDIFEFLEDQDEETVCTDADSENAKIAVDKRKKKQ